MRDLVFATITTVLSFLIYVYPLNVLAHLLFAAEIIEPVTIFPTVVIGFAVFVYFRTHLTSRLLSGVIYYGMGIGFIAFWVLNIGLLVSVLLPGFSIEIGLIGLVISMLVCVKAILSGNSIALETIHLTSPKIERKYNLIFISDIHLGSNPKRHLERICDQIHRLKYDHLLIGGDLFDSSAFNDDDLNLLKALETPIFFVTGNHEYYVKNHNERIANLTKFGFTVLDNQSTQFDELNIIGISDNQAPKTQSDIARNLISDDSFNLLMVHQPSLWHRAPEKTDLMLSGHTHNGQIFPFNLLVWMQFRTVYGMYRRLNSHLYVSSGSGTWGPRMRLGTQNEVVQISISPQIKDHQTMPWQ